MSEYVTNADAKMSNFLRWCESKYRTRHWWREDFLSESRLFPDPEPMGVLTEDAEYSIWQDIAAMKKEKEAA